MLPLLLTPIPPSYMVVPKSNIANTHISKNLMSSNIENTKARPDDTALSIQQGCPPSCASTDSSHSSFPSLMDDSPPSDCEYMEWVAAQNNIDIVADNAPPFTGLQKYDFTMLPSLTPCAPHKNAPNDLSVMRAPRRRKFPVHSNTWLQISSYTMKKRYK